MKISVLFVINVLMLELKWGEVVSPEITDVPAYRSGYSTSSSGAEP
jgi:hypothetical protein